MLTNDELKAEFYARPLSQQKAFLREVSPRGAVAVSRDEVHWQMWNYLTQAATINGEFYDEWLMNLTLEDLEAVRQRPTPEELYELDDRLKKNKDWLTEEDLDRVAAGPPKDTLSLLAWLWTTQGWTVWRRDGKEKFFKWASLQTEKLIKFKKMKMNGLMNEVRQRLGRQKEQKHPPKGDLLRYGREAKNNFLMAACFTWRNRIPQTVLLKAPDAYYPLQHSYINDLAITQPLYRVYRHPTYLHFARISK